MSDQHAPLTPALLGKLKRNELQRLAMANDIKGNQKSVTLIDLLLTKHIEGAEEFVFTDCLTGLLSGTTNGTEANGDADAEVADTQRTDTRTRRGQKRPAPDANATGDGSSGNTNGRRLRPRRGEAPSEPSGEAEAGLSEAPAVRGKRTTRGRTTTKRSTKEKVVVSVTVKAEDEESELSALSSKEEDIDNEILMDEGGGKGNEKEGSGTMDILPASQRRTESSPIRRQDEVEEENARPGHAEGQDGGEEEARAKTPDSYGWTTPTHTPPGSPHSSLELPSNLQSPKSGSVQLPKRGYRRAGLASPGSIKDTLAMLAIVQERDEELRDEVVKLRETAKDITQQARMLQERMKSEKGMVERMDGYVRYWRGGGYYNKGGVEDYEDGRRERGEEEKGTKGTEWRPGTEWTYEAIWSGQMRVLRAVEQEEQIEVTSSDEEGPDGFLYRLARGDVKVKLQPVRGDPGILDTLDVGAKVPEEYLRISKEQAEERERREATAAEARERAREERREREREEQAQKKSKRKRRRART